MYKWRFLRHYMHTLRQNASLTTENGLLSPLKSSKECYYGLKKLQSMPVFTDFIDISTLKLGLFYHKTGYPTNLIPQNTPYFPSSLLQLPLPAPFLTRTSAVIVRRSFGGTSDKERRNVKHLWDMGGTSVWMLSENSTTSNGIYYIKNGIHR